MSYYERRRPQSHQPSIPHHFVSSTTYTDTPSSTYFARLSEKADPSGTIHLNSYDSEPSGYYRQPVYAARPPPPRIVREVVREEVREPTRVVQERVVMKERVEPEKKVEERKPEQSREVKERGFVRGAAGKGAGAIWKALGGGESRAR